jgi:hypothetical protein
VCLCLKRSEVFATSEVIKIKGRVVLRNTFMPQNILFGELCAIQDEPDVKKKYLKKNVQVRGKEGLQDLGGSIFSKVCLLR